ncbi:hypothetical protein [Streptomyces chryseus]|uniref:hypothetical protein n=1 Tax=Streptomyces chryseus TaxID=68186 RepID=UPI00110FDA91|nr:hypothetical protein [Streptomyces chryseus]GGW99835.1 hypothetical protein GCM10010353_14400 [Streptomyces chryseus]
MSDTTEEETREAEAPEGERPFRVRDVFQFRRAGAPEADEEPADEGAAPGAPPMPTEPPTIPAARVGREARDDNHDVPAWWAPKADITAAAPTAQACQHLKPYTFTVKDTGEVIPHWCPDCKTDLTPDAQAAPEAKPKTAPAAPARPSGPCQHPEPHEVRNKVTGQLLAFWCADCETQLEVPDDYDELTDVTKEDDGGEDGEDAKPADPVPPSIRQRWTQGIRGTGQKSYSRPVYAKDSAERKKALIEVWSGMSRKQRHLLYNGTALGAGFYLGVPQFFTAEVAYLVDTYDSWTDFYVCIWYGVAVALSALDYRTRGWFPVFSWLTRIPLVSMIVGVLLYGNPAA